MWRILVVDDQENIRALVRTLLEKDGSWEVCGKAQALDLCGRLNPDLIVVNAHMPNLSGGNTAIRLIARDWPQIRILVLSVDESVHFPRAAEESGPHGFLPKGQSTAHLAEAVDALRRNGSYFVLPSRN